MTWRRNYSKRTYEPVNVPVDETNASYLAFVKQHLTDGGRLGAEVPFKCFASEEKAIRRHADRLRLKLKLIVVAVAIAGLVGCKTTEYRGSTVVWSQTKYGLNTVQPCLYDAEFIRQADIAFVSIIQAVVEAKLAPSAKTAAKLVGEPGVCLIQKPEACRISAICAQGSTGQDCLPRAGCSGSRWAWVSLEWPVGTVRDYRGDLVHELADSISGPFSVVLRADHQDVWTKTVKARALELFWAAQVGR